MKVLFVGRSTLYTVFGGDSVQMQSTAKYLRILGVTVDIKLTNDVIDYEHYDLLHFFNIIRPADILKHVRKSRKPYVVSTIFVDFSAYEQKNRQGIVGLLSRVFSSDRMEYFKTLGRWLKNGNAIGSIEYLFSGHRASVIKVAEKATLLLPNSLSEYERFKKHYQIDCPFKVVYNGIDTEIFLPEEDDKNRNLKQILCVGRIEGNKNQLNLIRALNNTEFELYIIGKPAPNHTNYYEKCRAMAGHNIHFLGFLPHEELSAFYPKTKVHVLPSWNETCGLSSLEAAYSGCNIVVTDKGDTAEYFGKDAWYCDPASPESIYAAVKDAAESPANTNLRQKIKDKLNWQQTAHDTLHAYHSVLNAC